MTSNLSEDVRLRPVLPDEWKEAALGFNPEGLPDAAWFRAAQGIIGRHGDAALALQGVRDLALRSTAWPELETRSSDWIRTFPFSEWAALNA